MKFSRALSFLLLSLSFLEKSNALPWNYDLTDPVMGPNNWGAIDLGEVSKNREKIEVLCSIARIDNIRLTLVFFYGTRLTTNARRTTRWVLTRTFVSLPSLSRPIHSAISIETLTSST